MNSSCDQWLTHINQVHRKSLFERVWNYQQGEACKTSHQSKFNMNLLFLIAWKHPLSCLFFIGCVVLISITVTERRRGAGQWLSLSAHSCSLMGSMWGTDNFHRADWVQELICWSIYSEPTWTLSIITYSSCRVWKETLCILS